ncbi:hypothetical protein [Arenicella xantha]|nr:hypothetical protein [Arenicella xantha]
MRYYLSIAMILLASFMSFLYKDYISAVFLDSYEIEFEIKLDGRSENVHIGTFADQRENLKSSGEIVVVSSEVEISITYPLNSPSVFKVHSEGGFTRLELVDKISELYKMVYEEEEATTKISIIPVEKRMEEMGLINRNTTDGKYQIWGHDLGDLVLDGAHIYKDENGIVSVNLYVQS